MKISVFWDIAPCSLVVLTDVSVAITLMMAAVSSSEASINICQTTQRNILENSQLRPQSSLFPHEL
jgi:hypothetical protein